MNNHLSNSLKGVHFKCMPDVPYDIVFHRQSVMNDNGYEENVFRAPLGLIKRSFFPTLKNVEYIKNNSKILFYISDPGRKSSEVNFMKAVSTVDNADVLIERHNKGHFSMHGLWLLFVLCPIWVVQMCGRSLSALEKYQVLKELLDLYLIQLFFRQMNIRQYNLLVCYYDSLVHECVLTLLFQKESLATATLEHGQFNAWREKNIANCGLEFVTSHSDYHLCWNKFAKYEALKSGLKEDHLPIVGILSNIGRRKERCIKPNNGIFGVVISNPSWEFENYEMIKAANILSQKANLKYYLKLHPNYKENYFENVIVADYYLGNIAKGIDTLEYTNMVDFSIVGSSSVFVEMIYMYHDILRYSSLLPSDKFSNIKLGSVFHSASDIESCYKSMDEESKSKLFDLLCETENTYQTYHNFFIQFVKE